MVRMHVPEDEMHHGYVRSCLEHNHIPLRSNRKFEYLDWPRRIFVGSRTKRQHKFECESSNESSSGTLKESTQ